MAPRLQLLYLHIFGHAGLGYATADTARRRPTLRDVHRQPKINMAATETGNGNNRLSLQPDSNGYPHICDHAGHVCDIADADRRWLVTGIHDAATTSGFDGRHVEFR